VEAGADLQQGAHPPVDLGLAAVGSVTRDRILSRVLLPAPLRPITPSTWLTSSSRANRDGDDHHRAGARPTVPSSAQRKPSTTPGHRVQAYTEAATLRDLALDGITNRGDVEPELDRNGRM
jgi:hypothetical protein